MGQWLELREHDAREAGAILEATARRAASRVSRRRWDGDDAAHDAEVLALDHECAALRRVLDPSTPLIVWLRGCVRNLCREKEKEKEKEKEPLNDLPDTGMGPAALAEVHEDACAALALLGSLPPPFGLALYLRLALGLTFREIRDRLSAVHPVSLAQVARIVLEAEEMLRAAKAGDDPRRRWPGRFDPKKNHWIGRKLPPLPPPTW